MKSNQTSRFLTACFVVVLCLGLTACPGGGDPGPDGGEPGSDGGGGGGGGGSPDGGCLAGTVLKSVGKTHLLVGAQMEDSTATQAPFDLRYLYLAGGIFDGTSACTSCTSNCNAGGTSCAGGGCAWWGCWQDTSQPPGQYALGFISTGKTNKQIPMFTYYELLHTSGMGDGPGEVAAANNLGVMRRYLADWRFLLQKIGNDVAFLHIEPDFWGYAQYTNSDPHKIAAQVATANPTDCGSQENSIAGLGRCMISMVRKYAPNAKVGLHASSWATQTDVYVNTIKSFDVAGEAKKVGLYLLACGSDQADFVVVEMSDRDAGYYQSIGENAWWDNTNATLPDFHQAFAWAKAVSETVGKPMLWWQLPVGNMNLANTWNTWRDNRLDYIFGHMGEIAGTNAVGVAFGAGADGMTTPESDNGHLVSQVKAYSQNRYVVCPQ